VDEPVDGYTIEREEEAVLITFSNRYGEAETFRFTLESVRKFSDALAAVVR
jgi:hypothetical protein